MISMIIVVNNFETVQETNKSTLPYLIVGGGGVE